MVEPLCVLGMGNTAKVVRFDSDFELFVGHGVMLVRPPGFQLEDGKVGVPYGDVWTLVDGPGGIALKPGDLLVHAPAFCEQGLIEAAR